MTNGWFRCFARCAILLILICTGGATWSRNHQAAGITSVEYGMGGVSAGRFTLVGDLKWAEFDTNGRQTYVFDEVSRDDSSIKIEDRSRDLALTLDVRRSVVTFGAIGADQSVLYEILGATGTADEAASAAAADEAASTAATNETVAKIAFGEAGEKQGDYVRTPDGRWEERDTAGSVRYIFNEASRDASGVVVEDVSRGISLKFDVLAMVISYGPIGQDMQPLYRILSAEAGSTPATSTQEQAVAPTADSPLRIIKLKHIGWYKARFAVTWTDADASGAEVGMSWDSGEQPAPYFHLLTFPETARAISIRGSGKASDDWNEVLAVTLDRPSNLCYEMAGTSLSQTYETSKDTSEVLADDCP